MVKKQVLVGSSMEERPIAMLVQTAGRFSSSLHLDMDNKHINLKSIMGVISIGSLSDHNVIVTAEGSDEEQACDAIVEFLQ
ncbi:MAG: HPr family phosphocarrier protein [Firmicutes bacterium]|nr:HPr family phosphocarrier protein [Bacillota bacterium]